MKSCVVSCVFLVVVMSAARAQVLVQFGGYIQGTTYKIKYLDDSSRDDSSQVDSLLLDFDRHFSIYDSTSVVSLVNQNVDIVIDSLFANCFYKSMEVSVATGGAFDITSAPVISLWGFGNDRRSNISKKQVDSVLQFVGYTKITIEHGKIVKKNPRVSLNFNAIAQGYSVDIVSQYLLRQGITSFVVEIGGEVYAHGLKPDCSPWIIGIESPVDNSSDSLNELQILIGLSNKAISTSGNYRKFYIDNGIKYSHTVNPITGFPVKNTLLSASIIAPDCATADAFATACMVKGLDGAMVLLQSHPELDAFLMYVTENNVTRSFMTPGFSKLVVNK